jgi:hypothetical protein
LEENYRPNVLFIRTSARVRVYPADAVLPVDGFLLSADAVKTASARTHLPPLPSPSLPSPPPSPSLPTPLCCPHGREKNKKIFYYFFNFNFNFGSCCRLGKRDFFFNFQFSIFGFQSPKSPNSPNSPSSAGFAGEAVRRRRIFRPNSPSHPSKLYSSLGWLNSKVPKPFPPFSLRLIDVDGF